MAHHGEKWGLDEISANGSDGTTFVYGGAALGFVLSWPLSLTSTVPSSVMVVVLGLPLAVVAVALLNTWVKYGRTSAWLPTIGIAVLLVNLLAAGGIGFPGVVGTLWLLLAVRLNLGKVGLLLPRYAALAGLATIVMLALTCYNSGYWPVLRCQTLLRQADRQPIQAELLLRAAAEADPLSVKPWNRLAWLAFSRWQQTKSPDDIKQFELCNSNAIKLTPNSSALQLATGDRYLAFYSKTHQPIFVKRAVEAYAQAVKLYPNNGLYRAKLAVALKTLGRQAEFEREAGEALRLDELTPHIDKKLPKELRKRLIRSQ